MYTEVGMSGTGLLGDFEQLVLLALLRHRDDGYAVLIRQEIEAATDRPVSRGALYRTLDRLAEKGLVRFDLETPTPERGGNARKRFAVTADGIEALRRARSVVGKLSAGLEDVLEVIS
jgi:DNA-binding PadR family transcriptional regulator